VNWLADWNLQGDDAMSYKTKKDIGRQAKKYTLSELLQQCDLNASIPEELQDWEMMEPIGREILPAITVDRYARANE